MSEQERWFKKGYEAAMRTNRSGCVCRFDENDNIVSICDAHREYFEERFKPLRWRTGLPGKEMSGKELVIKHIDQYGEHYYLGKCWPEYRELSMCCGGRHLRLTDETQYIPLSDILGLVEG